MPRIGVTTGFGIVRAEGGTELHRLTLDVNYCDMIRRAGGRPIVIPPTEDRDCLVAELDDLDGLLLSGSNDIVPARYGAEPHPQTEPMLPRRDASDFSVIAFADERELPVLAVCGGLQEWNAHRGGTLIQHIPDREALPEIVHRDPQRKQFLHHRVRLAEGSLLRRIAGNEWLTVNSWHHQALDRMGHDLVPTAWSDDGIIEAAEDPHHQFWIGVQWHPENMVDDPIQRRLFNALVEAAGKGVRKIF